MKSRVSSIAVLLAVASSLLPPHSTSARTHRHNPSADPRVCATVDDGDDAGKLSDVEYAGIVPGRGLSAEDFEGDGLEIVPDESLYLITDDPIGVLTRAAHNWEIPGTMIKFHVTDHPIGPGNVVHAMGLKQAARATVGRPGWGRSGSLDMALDVPFSRGDDSLVAVVTHEMGHWLGFDHSFLGSTVMFPVLTDLINWVDPDQVAKAVARYGVGPNALGEVRGTVTRAGAPLVGARINLLGANDRTAFGTFAGTDGVYHVPVFAGTYRLVVDPNDGPAVKGNFIGTYPGGPLDFATLEVPGNIVVSAGDAASVDVDVPVGGDVGFRITTDEPTVCSPGAGAQGVSIYYVGARPDEIASVEPLTADLHVTNLTDTGGQLDVFVDVDLAALPGPRAFRVRKTNGAVAIVTGLVGVVGQYWLEQPAYTEQVDPSAPITVSWIDALPRGNASRSIVSASIDGGLDWQELARLDASKTSYTWTPDPNLSTSALRIRVQSVDSNGTELAVDVSIFNLGLGRPARGVETGTSDTVPPTVTVLYPNGGETLALGEPVRLAWVSDDDLGIATQSVEVSVDGGARWTSLGVVPATARRLDWTTGAKAADGVLLRVTVGDHAGNTSQDVSDAVSRLRPRPTVSKVTVKPKAGELQVKIKGSGLGSGTLVEINGLAVDTAVTYDGARSTLRVRGTAAVLHLQPAGTPNQLVVTLDGLASSPIDFSY